MPRKIATQKQAEKPTAAVVMSRTKKRSYTAYASSHPKPELKASDQTINGTTAVNTTGAFTLLNGLVPGTGLNQRVGRKLLVKYINFRGVCGPDSAFAGGNTSVGQQHRYIIFADRDSNGAAPTLAQLLDSAAPWSQYNLDNRGRFKILADWTHEFPGIAASAAGQPSNGVQSFDVKIPCTLSTLYNAGTAGTVADIQSNAIYLFAIGSAPSGITDGQYFATVRIRYFDN